MQKNNRTVELTKNLADVFYNLRSVKNIQILGGCTETGITAEKSMTIRAIPELSSIEKRERFIDFGPAVTLSQMIKIGKANMPAVLYDALESIGTEAVRNMATLGGNICSPGIKHTLWAPLLALNAQIEVRNQNETKFIPFSKFSGVPKSFVMTKIRVPFDEWGIEIFRRVGPSRLINPLSAAFVFLVETQKGIVANIRIAFAGSIVFSSQELENKIIGIKLPIARRDIDTLIQETERVYDEKFSLLQAKPILKIQFLNLLRYALEQLM
ncbi:FAD binding domain-containing protein [Treponema peruense]|uniref:FAD binding domain-containing protein n=1 Tax=Treponema peruense TaxID=2787628 RepID=A0A7T3V454_9SPIR|nr:FAD binding domain-containing protein [Treponema peruense]QQA00163.1 FAD binding domain-containing protein [Treponema peruense]